MCKVRHGSIVFANIPYNEHNPHQHHGPHYYIVVSNPQACNYSPVVQAIPLSSNINRRLPVQIEIKSDCFPKRSFALAEQLTLKPNILPLINSDIFIEPTESCKHITLPGTG